MASRSRTTFKKRQKELARMEKQRDKAAKRKQRKADKLTGGGGLDADGNEIDANENEEESSMEAGVEAGVNLDDPMKTV